MATRLRAPFRVQTRGRNSPVASAKPATVPVESRLCRVDLVYAVPLVPTETTAVPLSPKARPAAMLSPVPAARAMPSGVCPTISSGAGDPGNLQIVSDAELDQVSAVLVRGRIEVAGS